MYEGMIQQRLLLLVFLSFITLPSIKAFAINNAKTDHVYQRVKRSGSANTPNIIEMNNEISDWPLNNENNVMRNDLMIGQCDFRDQRIYTDETVVENSGPSTLNGTLEIYVNAPIKITCVKVEDQITDGTGAIPSYNSGGVGTNWIFIDVKCKYGKGFHFKIHIFGVPSTSPKTSDEFV